MKRLLCAALAALMPVTALAQDVLVLGEVHDNPAHHETQAARVAQLQPAAIVFEMLTPAQAARVAPDLRDDPEKLGKVLEWEARGWPDFGMYYPIFAAAPQARIYGAGLPRAQARDAMETGIAESFGGDPAAYGLDRPLPEDERAAREAEQMAAHCDALPESALPGMVAIQRLRDAMLARAAVRAVRDTGGPVAVITGNGHARADRGMPRFLRRVAPDLDVHVVGQTEDDRTLPGRFDEVISAPGVDRPDPCAAFSG
ncbi:ChaN family lipoprotein [Roseovarius salinarum]|uniref:ChaN family lipoprotein n=1 Tax=Roseovarius salinarum TaxID=1981892 RepID=UPI000C34635E|nr:ChaN family lipoprotein [Roseovarius salinarum]